MPTIQTYPTAEAAYIAAGYLCSMDVEAVVSHEAACSGAMPGVVESPHRVEVPEMQMLKAAELLVARDADSVIHAPAPPTFDGDGAAPVTVEAKAEGRETFYGCFVVVGLLILTLLTLVMDRGRGYGEGYWDDDEDGNYYIYARAEGREVVLGMHQGISVVIEPTVVAAGQNGTYMVFQRQPDAGHVEYYFIEKSGPNAGHVSGPFTTEAFEKLAEEKSLPEFRWHLRR